MRVFLFMKEGSKVLGWFLLIASLLLKIPVPDEYLTEVIKSNLVNNLFYFGSILVLLSVSLKKK